MRAILLGTTTLHTSPRLYDIFYVEPKISRVCFLFLPKSLKDNGDSVSHLGMWDFGHISINLVRGKFKKYIGNMKDSVIFL